MRSCSSPCRQPRGLGRHVEVKKRVSRNPALSDDRFSVWFCRGVTDQQFARRARARSRTCVWGAIFAKLPSQLIIQKFRPAESHDTLRVDLHSTRDGSRGQRRGTGRLDRAVPQGFRRVRQGAFSPLPAHLTDTFSMGGAQPLRLGPRRCRPCASLTVPFRFFAGARWGV